MQPLQTLSGISGLQLRVVLDGPVYDLDHPIICQLVKQHGQIISHLTVEAHVHEDRLKLRDVSEAAALCRSIDLTVCHPLSQVLDLADLEPVAGSLQSLTCQSSVFNQHGSLIGVSAFNRMAQLTALHVYNEDLGSEEPWGVLATLTDLRQLGLRVSASGDPSQLSTLTGLSTLRLHSIRVGANHPPSFNLSSLQPLSTLQQLEVLQLGDYACAATSLQGLAGLSNLKLLEVESSQGPTGSGVTTLEGISPWVTYLAMAHADDLQDLAGIGICTSLRKLTLHDCGVSSLQPLRRLSSVKHLVVSLCPMVASLEGLNNMSLQSLSLTGCEGLYELSGLEDLSALTSLELLHCALTSLQPLSQLGEGLQVLRVYGCHSVEDEVLQLPHVKPTANVSVHCSHVREVVLCQGVVRRMCGARHRFSWRATN
jgi:Leucine-rich repeat (LRR) protein